jgi:hypothetical protein
VCVRGKDGERYVSTGNIIHGGPSMSTILRSGGGNTPVVRGMGDAPAVLFCGRGYMVP